LKLLIVYETVYPDFIGGVEHRNYELAAALCRRGHEVTLAGFCSDLASTLPNLSILSLGELGALYNRAGKRSTRQALRFAAAVRRIDLSPFDVVESPNMPYIHLLPLAWMCSAARRPLLITWYEYWGGYWRVYVGRLRAPVYRAIEWLTAQLGAAVTATSNLTRGRLAAARWRAGWDELDAVDGRAGREDREGRRDWAAREDRADRERREAREGTADGERRDSPQGAGDRERQAAPQGAVDRERGRDEGPKTRREHRGGSEAGGKEARRERRGRGERGGAAGAGDRVDVVPCGIAVSRVQAAAGNRPGDGPPLIYAGRLLEHKRLDVVLRAVRILARGGGGAGPESGSGTAGGGGDGARGTGGAAEAPILTVFGEGPDRERLEALAGELGVAGRVVFRGHVKSSEEVWRELGRARLAVQPSAREGFGLFPLEAMAAGLPVVFCGSPESAVGELVRDGVEGIAVAADPAALAGTLAALLAPAGEDERLRLSRNALARAARYDWEEIAQRIEEICLDLIARRRR
jgi:glycosyltransferase involved in cell wall biosynthesis